MRAVAVGVAVIVIAGCAVETGEYDDSGELAALAAGKADGPSAPHKQWTFLYYGAGDNDLADAVRIDANELESFGSTKDINFLAFIDQGKDATDNPNGHGRVYYLQRDIHQPLRLLSPSVDWGEVDSGDPQTLVHVTDWAAERFPADHIALVISGHGGGTPRQIAFDFSTGNAISAPELEDALQHIKPASGHLELFGADACLVQSFEVAYQLRSDVAFVVGSEKAEPSDGWDYRDIAQSLIEGVEQHQPGGEFLAEAMVDSYGRRAGSERTLSALDTAGLAASRVSQLRQLARAITEYAQSAAGKTELQAVAQSVLRDPDADDDFADAADLAQRLQTTSDPQIRMLGQQLALMLSSSLDAPALVHVSSGPASGISIYFPRSAQTVDAYLTGGAFAADTGWADAVRAIW